MALNSQGNVIYHITYCVYLKRKSVRSLTIVKEMLKACNLSFCYTELIPLVVHLLMQHNLQSLTDQMQIFVVA